MDTLPIDYIRYLKDVQAHLGHEANAFKAARLLEVRVRPSRDNYVVTDADPPIMHLQPWWYGWSNDVVRHELAHIILAWSNIEAHLIREYGSREAAQPFIENLCNQAVAFLHITQPMVDEAVRRHGVTARAVRHLQQRSGAGVATALRRLIYDDPHAERAGFLTSGNYIKEVAMCNHGLPFGWLDRVPEPALKFPREAPASFFRLPGGLQLIGVCGA